MLILHNKSIQQHSGISQTKMRLGPLSTHIGKITMHTILGIKHESYHTVWMCFWDSQEVWDSLDAHRDRRRTGWWTISFLLIEQLPWLTQINLTWLLCCIKKNPKQSPALLKLDVFTIHTLLSNLQQPDIATAWAPSLQREVNTHHWEKEYSFFFSQLWLGHDAKQQLSYPT